VIVSSLTPAASRTKRVCLRMTPMSELGLGRVKTQRRANCRETYSFGSPVWEREEHTELRQWSADPGDFGWRSRIPVCSTKVNMSAVSRQRQADIG
jgi:hypothetical protein